jgi:[ribosomal protein S5]-alanine N-acetyltransferase
MNRNPDMNSLFHPGLDIVTTQIKHTKQLSDYYLRNQERFLPWHPRISSDHHSVDTWELRLKEREIDFRDGRAVHFIGLENDKVVGACSLTNILYSPACSCNLGYSVDSHYEGAGAMTRIVKHAIAFCFENLELNRISANYMPANTRSARLLEKLGFEKEGFAKRYLCINGRWEDHILTSLINPGNSVGVER